MPEETITVPSKQKKDLKDLATLLGDLGFTKISYSKKTLSLEKIKGNDLRGNPYLEYRIDFNPDSVSFTYSFSAKTSRMARLLSVLPTFLNILQVAEDYYIISPTAIFSHVNAVLAEVSKMVDRDSIEFSTQLSELQTKHEDLNSKYDSILRSREANTRILLECERKRDELQKKLDQLTGMSDDLLKESLYDWIKLHGGSIDVREFSKANSVAISRTEEGLNMLIGEGFIRRRSS